jgi:predicted dehydrogenase
MKTISEHISKGNAAGGLTRRSFFKGSIALSALAMLTPVSRVIGANDRFRIAICGMRGRGNSIAKQFLSNDNVEIAWIVDPDKTIQERRGQEIMELTGKKPRLTHDVRYALDDPELDAIVVTTPNHWHSLMVIWAAQAGKHCYVEKPASHSFYEGRVALEAAGKYGVVVQHGTQRRSERNYANLIKAIHSGKYGRLTISHGFASKARRSIEHRQHTTPPHWLDWNMWRGPAMVERYHENLVHYNWHWFWMTGNGELNNQGTHQLDVAFWALDPEMHSQHPTRVMSLGGRYVWDDQGETPNTQFSIAEYPNGQKVLMNIRNVGYEGYEKRVENRYYFEDGGKIIGDEYISPGGVRMPIDINALEESDMYPGGPTGSFVNACRAGDPRMVNAGMLEGHYSSGLGHLMNISYRLGRNMPFSENVVAFNDSEVEEQFNWFHSVMRDGVGLGKKGLETNMVTDEYRVGPWLTFDSDSEKFIGEFASNANLLLRNPNRTGFEIPDLDKI